ncbi:MAG: DUF2510 domain-containing protein [Acidimicrobiales bacterium]
MTDPRWSGYPPQYPTAPPTHPEAPAGPPPSAKAPGWYADPSGRHQFRFWDGATWADTVADRGVASHDPVAGTPAGYRQPYVGPWAPPITPKRGRGPLLAVLGVVVVIGLAAAGLLVFLDDGGDGSGNFARELENDGDTRVHTVTADPDTVVLIRVITSDENFDPVIGVTTDGATLDELADFFESDGALDDEEFPGALPEDGALYAVADNAAAGEDEVTFVATPFGGEFNVLVTGLDDSVGPYELEVTIEEFVGPDDPQAYAEELASQDFVEDFAPPRSPIEDVLDDFIDDGD